MSKIKKCPECDEILGNNDDCQTCLQYMFEHGRQNVEKQKRSENSYSSNSFLTGKFLQIKLTWDLMKDYLFGNYEKTPWAVIFNGILGIFYLLSPLDLIPDIIPVLGWLDDLGILMIFFYTLKRELKLYCHHKGFDPRNYGL